MTVLNATASDIHLMLDDRGVEHRRMWPASCVFRILRSHSGAAYICAKGENGACLERLLKPRRVSFVRPVCCIGSFETVGIETARTKPCADAKSLTTVIACVIP